MKEKINRLFNRISQEFFIGKRHLMSCNTIEQAKNVSDWMSDINTNWDNLIDIVCSDLDLSSGKEVYDKYHALNEAMAKEWGDICDIKIQELTPPPPDEPRYPDVVKFEGFC